MEVANEVIMTKEAVTWKEDLAPAKPFLVPNEDGDPVEVLPSEKPNRRVRWTDTVELLEIDNRSQLGLVQDDDDSSYGMEVLDDDKVYEDFYLVEIISDDEDESINEGSDSEELHCGPLQGLQLPIEAMMAPPMSGIPISEYAQFQDFDRFMSEIEPGLTKTTRWNSRGHRYPSLTTNTWYSPTRLDRK